MYQFSSVICDSSCSLFQEMFALFISLDIFAVIPYVLSSLLCIFCPCLSSTSISFSEIIAVSLWIFLFQFIQLISVSLPRGFPTHICFYSNCLNMAFICDFFPSSISFLKFFLLEAFSSLSFHIISHCCLFFLPASLFLLRVLF